MDFGGQAKTGFGQNGGDGGNQSQTNDNATSNEQFSGWKPWKPHEEKGDESKQEDASSTDFGNGTNSNSNSFNTQQNGFSGAQPQQQSNNEQNGGWKPWKPYETLGACRNCNQEGHYSRDCPEPRNENNRPPRGEGDAGGGRNCFNCNQPGHISRECPNKNGGGGGRDGDGDRGFFGQERRQPCEFMTEEEQALEPAIWPSPDYAVQFTTAVLGLTKAQQEILRHELYGTSEDPVLVLQLNPNWVPPANGPTANNILDAIATYNMVGNDRRDNKPGCHRWVFHFNNSGHIRECHQHLLANYPAAFAFGPVYANMAAQAFGGQVAQLRTEPLATAVVINKLAVREDDAADYPLFVTD